MSNIDERLLKPPVARAAYSDRTAWLMAEMSRLAYHNFDQDNVPDEMVNEMAGFKFQLVSTFDNEGTQAFLSKRDSDKIAILAFRGTENDPRDQKANYNARFYSDNGAKIHDGYNRAFLNIEQAVREQAEKLNGYRLYITGHSMGGALALIATRALNSDNIAACYTFGSPRVGSSEFGDAIKPPIYRIINSADYVTMMPPTWPVNLLVTFCSFIPVPYLRKWVLDLLNSIKGYAHHGDMRYLTHCGPDYSEVRVITGLSFFEQARRFIRRVSSNLLAGCDDHYKTEYCAKLKAYAIKRLEEK
ncbi:MAG: lipase family protein [Candidatus Margulisiibacteriota bacterium]